MAEVFIKTDEGLLAPGEGWPDFISEQRLTGKLETVGETLRRFGAEDPDLARFGAAAVPPFSASEELSLLGSLDGDSLTQMQRDDYARIAEEVHHLASTALGINNGGSA